MKTIALLLFGVVTVAQAQIPVEVFGGHQKTTVDVMFFKFFKNKKKENSPVLFFNRNRASIDYRMTEKTYLPQFGFTEAISYNHKSLKGFAPVLVGQVLSWGVYPKAGVQYVFIQKDITVFTWLVCEMLRDPDLDYFLLFRYTPTLVKKLKLFVQVESVNAFPTAKSGNFNLTQRARLGLGIHDWQFGAGADFNQAGRQTFANTYNIGGFLRHEF